MTTKKPRITITLEPRTYNVLRVISECGDATMSGFVSEMLDAAFPTLERMAATFQAIKAAQEAERGRFLASMDRAQSALEPALMQAVGQFDMFLAGMPASVVTDAGPARGRRDASDPRPVTRGSTPLTDSKTASARKPRKPSSGAASRRKE